MPTESGNESLLTVEEVAQRLRVSIRSVRNLIRLGKIPIVRVTDRRIAIDENDVAAYISARRTAGAGQ